MIIDVAILDYENAKVKLISLEVPPDYTDESIETALEWLGYSMGTTSFMTAINIELSDERGNL